MKQHIFSILLSTLLFTNIQAQRGPLMGSGKVIQNNYSLDGFDKLSIKDFDGSIEVEVGKTYSIEISIDDNLAPLLDVSKIEGEQKLSISLKNNKNGRLYLENTNIKIKVTLPELYEIEHRGNTILEVTGIAGKYFKLDNHGNGNVYLTGNTLALDIKKSGNGEVKANLLTCNTAHVKSYGNGNVLVNAKISLSAFGAGNCSVMQFGNGSIEPLSGILGNGSVKMM